MAIKKVGRWPRNWYHNVFQNWRFFFNGEYKYYYCNRWCFLTDQHLCKMEKKMMDYQK